ncbi:Uncharacterized protein Rs2_06636 [Raphanus sativus]|uniref:Uncharacterized protein LOC108839339 n=1 Tax=Raphanus sativus TaxID=3726 RepID=A0A6J0M6Q0_RAPSA|nr:uncharacterized protein LOC108839339 [Raphanus sativus]KAJ4912015.1 Uncharacterized protein Rs2_06636 [Raphanus sativus]
MEVGEGSSSRGRPKRPRIRKTEVISYEKSVVQLSREGRQTHLVVDRARKTPLNTRGRSYSTVFDNTSPQYNWLRDGWLVEERRIMLTGRLYRYYYDPLGQVYGTRHEVEQICAYIDRNKNRKKREVIIID